MVQTLIEVVSLVAIVAGVVLLAGAGAGLVAGGVAGLVVSWRIAS